MVHFSSAALLLLAFSPLGHAGGLKASIPSPRDVRGIQTHGTTATDFLVPGSNGRLRNLKGKGKGKGSEISDPDDVCCEAEKPFSLTFLFNDEACVDPLPNPQQGKAGCTDFSTFNKNYFQVRVLQSDKAVFDSPGSLGSYTSSPIQVGDTVTIRPADGKFKSDTTFSIFKCNDASAGTTECKGATKVQEIEIHLSCSKDLFLGDVFGSLTVDDYNDSERSLDCAVCVNTVPGGGQDAKCSAFTPLCNGLPDKAGDECFLCEDDKPRGLKDSGCTDECKLCVPTDGDYGNECKVCNNDKVGDAADEGCTEERPVCLAEPHEYGDECITCIANEDPFDINPPHEGCDLETPICDGDEMNDFIGTACFKCQRLPQPALDPGCTDPDYPFCVAPDFGFGDCCASCINDNVSNGRDTGCTDESPFCIAKYHEGGNLCAVCINDEADPTIPDSGCDAEEPQCNGDFGEPGTACELVIANPPLNSVLSAHGNTDWHIDTAEEFLFGTDIDGNPSAANFAPATWTRNHIHIGDMNTNRFYYDESLVFNGDDTNIFRGIDRAMLFFYAGHGNPVLFNTLGNNAFLGDMLIGNGVDQSLRYYWQCSCNVFAHGPQTCADPSLRDFGCPADFTPGTADSFAMRNVYERWGPILGDNLRMACGGSTSMFCHESNTNRAWDNYNNNGMDVADSFINGFSGRGVVPLCIAIGGSTPGSSPLSLDTAFTNAPNPRGDWFHIQYLGGAGMETIRRKLNVPEDVPSKLPILELSPQNPTQIWIDEATEQDGDLLVSNDTVGDRGPRWTLNTKSGAMYARGERILSDKTLSDEDYLANATDLVNEFGWSEDLKGNPIETKMLLDILPREDMTAQIQRSVKSVTISWYRLIELNDIGSTEVPGLARMDIDDSDNVVPVLSEAGGGGGGVITVQLNNDGSLLNAAKVWRTIESETLFLTKTFEDALSEAQDVVGDNISEYTLDDWSFGYKEEAGNIEQTEMTMYYVFEFEPTDPDAVLEFPPQIVEIKGIRKIIIT